MKVFRGIIIAIVVTFVVGLSTHRSEHQSIKYHSTPKVEQMKSSSMSTADRMEIAQLNQDLNGDSIEESILLYYENASINLKVNNAIEKVHKTPLGSSIIYNALKDCEDEFKLSEFKESNYIGLSYIAHNAKGIKESLDIYQYKNNKILKVWSSADIDAAIESWNLLAGEITIKFPYLSKSFDIEIEEDEIEAAILKFQELRNEGYSETEVYQHIKESIVCNIKGYTTVGSKNKRENKLLLHVEIIGVGAMMPFELNEEGINCSNSTLTNDTRLNQ